MQVPRTRYATTQEGVCVAYQVFGDGPYDLVYLPGWVTNIEVLWEWPGVARVFSRLASRCRVVLYDKQGTGLSDRVASLPGLEARMDDVTAVMDAAGMHQGRAAGSDPGRRAVRPVRRDVPRTGLGVHPVRRIRQNAVGPRLAVRITR